MTSILALFLAFAKVGLFTFGGGYAMIPLMEREFIESNGWLTMKEFVDIIAIAEMTPGPVAVNSATYIGYKVAGIAGGAAATLGVVFPSFIIMLTIAVLFLRFRDEPAVKAVSMGLRAGVAALIASAALSLAKAAIVDVPGIIISGLALIGLFRLKMHPIFAISIAGILGIVLWGKVV